MFSKANTRSTGALKALHAFSLPAGCSLKRRPGTELPQPRTGALPRAAERSGAQPSGCRRSARSSAPRRAAHGRGKKAFVSQRTRVIIGDEMRVERTNIIFGLRGNNTDWRSGGTKERRESRIGGSGGRGLWERPGQCRGCGRSPGPLQGGGTAAQKGRRCAAVVPRGASREQSEQPFGFR